MNILVNQVKCPEIYNECFCLGCNVNDGEATVKPVPGWSVTYLRSSFANKDNVNDNVNDIDKDNNDVKDKNNVNDNDHDNDNDLRSSFANNDKVIYHFDEKHQKGKPNNKECPTNTISININEDLQSWLNDDNIITETTLPESFRCIISGPSECSKTFLLKTLIISSIYFYKLYIIGPTGDQYRETSCSTDRGLERINSKADIEFIQDIKDSSSPDKLPKDLKKLMIFDDVSAKD